MSGGVLRECKLEGPGDQIYRAPIGSYRGANIAIAELTKSSMGPRLKRSGSTGNIIAHLAYLVGE